MPKVQNCKIAAITFVATLALLTACSANSDTNSSANAHIQNSANTAMTQQTTPGASIAPQDSCNAHAVDDLVGQPWRPELLEAARVRAGAAVARQLWTDSMVTKEYHFGRLNVVVDRQTHRIAYVRCG